MTMLANSADRNRSTYGVQFQIGARTRFAVVLVGTALTSFTLIALFRGLTGLAPAHPNLRDLAIVIHVSTVLPAIPLGAYLLLARKGGTRHKLLGKLWIALMVMTAVSAIFIQTGGSFSFIHVFVPLTLWSSFKAVTSARRRNFVQHRKEILGMYLGALAIPGTVAFAIPGRLMNVWLYW